MESVLPTTVAARTVQEFTFPAITAAAGQYIYLASDSAQFNNWFGFDADYVTSAVMEINGDDAIELFFYSGSVIDVFGDINVRWYW